MSIHMKSSSVVPDFVSSETGRRLQESKAASNGRKRYGVTSRTSYRQWMDQYSLKASSRRAINGLN
ncbi:hypothetical protein, partial [Citrobacter freundii]|uniref:hypothetical protein n=1 Tax=Citrobacter freundii TaxID=546 RepID=UPI001BA7EB64